MLNGIDPVIIFHFYKNIEDPESSAIPFVAKQIKKIGFIPIPIYLSESLTGLYIDTEDKVIDIATNTDASIDGDEPSETTQKALNSIVRITLKASAKSTGITLISALADVIFKKITSREYAISYLHGATTVFNGLLHSFSINQNSSDDLYTIDIELFAGKKGDKTVDNEVQKTGGVSLESGANIPNAAPGSVAPPPLNSPNSSINMGGPT